ncbi:MAG: hypothetical protein H0U99_04395 [Chthoniobacterales bacterium]|nr:hypothetical protein [Chthoniobacterales bacterium]
MPASYRIDPVRHTIFSRGWGVLVDEDLITRRRHVATDPSFDPAYDHVWNFLDFASVQLSTELLERLAAVPLSHSPACRALVAANGEALKLAQLFTSYSVQAARPVPGFPDFGRGPRVPRFLQAAVDWPPHPRLEVRQLRAFLSVALIQLCP